MARLACGRAIQSPADLANLVIWLEADAQSFEMGVSGISQWTDKSGNGNHAVQSTDANRPRLSYPVGTTPAVTYSSNSHYLESQTGSTNGDHTMFAIARWTGAPGGVTRGVCCWGATAGANSYISRATSANSLYGDAGASAEGAAITTNTVYLLSKVRQAALDVGQRARANLSEDARILTAPGGITTPKIGVGKDASSSTAMAGNIWTVIGYSRALSFGEVVAMERWLTLRWAPVLGL